MRNLAPFTHLVIVAVFASLGCQPKETKIIRESAPQSERIQPEGTSSGGGSFGDESSNYILNVAKEQLLASLRDLGRPISNNYPEGWSQERLRQVIAGVRTSKDKKISRHGTELMFNYGVDAITGDPYIEAVELFYTTYAGVAINHISSEEFLDIVREISLKLLHEAAHLMGIGVSKETDFRAREFARALLVNRGKLVMTCETHEELPVEANRWLRTGYDLGASLSCLDVISLHRGYSDSNEFGFSGDSRGAFHHGPPVTDFDPRVSSRKEASYGRSGGLRLIFDPTTGHSIVPDMIDDYGYGGLVIGKREHGDFNAQYALYPSGGRDVYAVAVNSDVRLALDALTPYSKERFGFELETMTKLGNLSLAGNQWIKKAQWEEIFPWETTLRLDFKALADERNKYRLRINDRLVTKNEAVILKYTSPPDSVDAFDSMLAIGAVTVQVEELVETIEYKPFGGYLDMSVTQKAKVQCGDLPAEPVNTELSIRLNCEQEPITPVDVISFID